jgi:hypothetical protein
VNSISPGVVVTGIFAKNVGVEGSPAKKIEGNRAWRFRHPPAARAVWRD